MDFLITKFCKLICRILCAIKPEKLDIPGQIALKYNQRILKKLSEKYEVILVTGTNGKRSTSTILSKIMERAGRNVICNTKFSDNIKGIMSFLFHEGDEIKDVAIVEIDESNVHRFTRAAKAKCLLGTNIFKNQLGRYGEIYNTIKRVKDGISNEPGMKLILNGDEPFFGNIEGDTIYYGFGTGITGFQNIEERSNVEGQFCIKCHTKYKYEFYTYNHLGKYKCPNCGYERPKLDYSVSNVNLGSGDRVSFLINNSIEITTNVGGVDNLYSVLGAITAAFELGIKEETIKESMKSFRLVIEQTHVIKLSDKKIDIMLIKNPASYNERIIIPYYNHNKKSAVFLLDDEYEDGKDISWIWDVDFENSFTNFEKIYVSGKRRYDMAIRLEVAGYDSRNIIMCNTIDNMIERIKKSKNDGETYVFATPTSYDKINRILQEQKIIYYSW